MRNRIFFADVLRLIAIFSVIVIHCIGGSHLETNHYGADWWSTIILRCLSQIGVPLFIMLSGMLILKSEAASSFSYVLKRVPKILIPLVFWSTFYEIYRDVVIEESPVNFVKIAASIYGGEVQHHLWFLYMILGLYVATPLLKRWIEKSAEHEVKVFILSLLILNGILGPIEAWTGVKNNFMLAFFSGNLGYYLLGYYLSQRKKERRVGFAFKLFCLSVFANPLIMYVAKVYNRDVFYSLLNNTSITSVTISVSTFLIVQSISWRKLALKYPCTKLKRYKKTAIQAVVELSKASYGIYLVHILVLGLLGSQGSPIRLNSSLISPVIGILVTSVATLIISYVVVKVMQKIPFVREVVP